MDQHSAPLHALTIAITRDAQGLPSLRAWRAAVLERLGREVPFDAAIFHALSPRVPLDTAVVVGIDSATVTATLPRWDRLAVELGRFRDLASTHDGVVSDLEACPVGTAARRTYLRELARPMGVRWTVLCHLTMRDAIRSGMVLFRRAGPAFDPAELALLRAVSPVIALADVAHQFLDGTQQASVPVTLRCDDQRLTSRQRQIVEHVALGHTNADIALALGISPNTLRNHLVQTFARLGASNRADVVRLAVLRTRSSAV